MTKIDSDLQLITELGFSQDSAADLLGRSRQAVNGGVKSPIYFKTHDIGALIIDARQRGERFDAAAVFNYVEASRGPEVRARLERLVGPSDMEALLGSAWDELWVILPDYRHLRRGDRRTDHNLGGVLDLPRRVGGATIRIICSSPIDSELLDADLRDDGAYNENMVVLEDDVVAAAQMSMIVGNPLSRTPTIFVPTRHGWTQVAFPDPENQVRALQMLFPKHLPRPHVTRKKA